MSHPNLLPSRGGVGHQKPAQVNLSNQDRPSIIFEWILWFGCSIWIAATVGTPSLGCPFCSAISNTLREDIGLSDIVCFADCTRPADVSQSTPLHQFRVTQVLRGTKSTTGQTIEIFSFQPYRRMDNVLAFGVGEFPNLSWASTRPVSRLAANYIRELMQLPASSFETTTSVSNVSADVNRDAESVKRLQFFYRHLGAEDELISKDCYNEFARASLAELRLLKPMLDRFEIIELIQDERTSIERRRLYWTLLSLCGQADDVAFVKDAIERHLAGNKSLNGESLGLDAAISCYLVLGGETALRQIEKDFLENPKAQYSDTYAAIVAIRVHAQEYKLLPIAALQRAFAKVLDNRDLADLVIPDLARWEDWTHIDRLVALFERADLDRQFVRLPIINYLRVCPLPEAQLALARCTEIDPGVVRRAHAFFPTRPSKKAADGRTGADSHEK